MISEILLSKITDKECPDVETALFILRDHYDIGNITYHLSQTIVGDLPIDSPYVKTTYPPVWVSRYFLGRYIEIDPIVRAGLLRALPFGWDEVPLPPEAAQMMADFAQHGFSTCGYTYPIVDKFGRRALFSFNARADEANWSDLVSRFRVEWAEIAHIIHKMALEELLGPNQDIPSLTRRELEVLGWCAKGKTYSEIAIIMSITPNTVRSYITSARYKLDCVNIPQAVTKATKLRLIAP